MRREMFKEHLWRDGSEFPGPLIDVSVSDVAFPVQYFCLLFEKGVALAEGEEGGSAMVGNILPVCLPCDML